MGKASRLTSFFGVVKTDGVYKNHSSSANRKSGSEFEFKVKFKFSKK